MPNLCGVNQKLFAEVLSQVKKTGDERRASVSPEKTGPGQVRGVARLADGSAINWICKYS